MLFETRECVKCKKVLPIFWFDRNPRIESGYDVKCCRCKDTDKKKYLSHLKGYLSML